MLQLHMPTSGLCSGLSSTSHFDSSFAALSWLAFFFSAFFVSSTSTARLIPCFSNNLRRWQNSNIKKEPKTKEVTAQLHEDQTVATRVSHFLVILTDQTSLPPQIALAPPMPNPLPIPVKNALRTQGFLWISVTSAGRIVRKPSIKLVSCTFPPAVFKPAPAARALAFGGAAGREAPKFLS